MTRSLRRVFERVAAIARLDVSDQLRRLLPNERQHLFALTLLVGLVCGLVAVLFHLSIDRAESALIKRALDPAVPHWWLYTLLCPTLGGLLSGVLLRWVFPGSRGSGIPQVKQAFALEGGRIRPLDALGKFVVTTLQVGSGASLGREGPTVQICAGAASLLARATSLPPRHMRRLMPVGVAAGIAAAFNAPIAAVTFTIEEIVGTLDHSILSGVVVAAALAAIIERGLLGVHPILQVDQSFGLDHPSSLPLYALLGVAAAFVSVLFTDGLLGLRAAFRRQRWVPLWGQPAVGGLVTGVLAVVALSTLGTTGVAGGGYDTLGRALAGQIGLRVLLALCALKVVATVASYSSGGAGGVFAPSLFIGAMLGGAFGHLDVLLLGHAGRSLGSFALVGMGAVFAGVIRAPITSVLIIFEMTGSYGLVLPLMLASATAYVLARRWRPTPLYDALLAQDGVVLPGPTSARAHALETLTVRDAMTEEVHVARRGESAAVVSARIGDRGLAEIPLVDDRRSLLGVLRREDLAAVAGEVAVDDLAVPPEVIDVDAPLLRAVVRMSERDRRRLVVTDGTSERTLVGVLSITDVLRAHALASTRSAEAARPSSDAVSPTTLASDLARTVPVVPDSARLDDILARLEESPGETVVVRGEGGAPRGLIRLGYLREFLRDPALQGILIAADIARPALSMDRGASIDEVRVAMAEKGIDAVIVSGVEGSSAQVVTRADLAERLLGEVGQGGRK